MTVANNQMEKEGCRAEWTLKRPEETIEGEGQETGG